MMASLRAHDDGATLFGRFAAEAVGGLRPRQGQPGRVGRALRREPGMGVEDFLGAEAHRADRETELPTWSQTPD